MSNDTMLTIVGELLADNTKAELLQLAQDENVKAFKSWEKTKVAAVIASARLDNLDIEEVGDEWDGEGYTLDDPFSKDGEDTPAVEETHKEGHMSNTEAKRPRHIADGVKCTNCSAGGKNFYVKDAADARACWEFDHPEAAKRQDSSTGATHPNKKVRMITKPQVEFLVTLHKEREMDYDKDKLVKLSAKQADALIKKVKETEPTHRFPTVRMVDYLAVLKRKYYILTDEDNAPSKAEILSEYKEKVQDGVLDYDTVSRGITVLKKEVYG